MLITLTIIAVLVALFLLRVTFEKRKVPTLGINNGQLAKLSSKPNCVSSQTDQADKRVPTLPFKETPEKTLEAIKQAVAAYGGAKVIEARSDYYYVVFITKLMRYYDDVEFYLDNENKEVHFRSSSRAGYSDMGLNRKRYNKLAELYQAQAV